MSLRDLDIDERTALALPQDWPGDYRMHPVAYNTCINCLRPFWGKIQRTLCRRCDYSVTPKDSPWDRL